MERRTANVNGIVFDVYFYPKAKKENYSVRGPGTIVEKYTAGPNAWTDVLCSHLGEMGNEGLIDEKTANVHYDEIERQLSKCFDKGCPIHDVNQKV